MSVGIASNKIQYEFNLTNFGEMKKQLSDQISPRSENISLVFKTIDVDNFSGIQRFFSQNSDKVTDFLLVHECSNTFNDQDCENISEYLKKMENLRSLQLHLRLNKINNGIISISRILPHLQSLEKISLRIQSNGITSEGLRSLAEGMNQLTSLKDVELMLLGNEIYDLSVFKCEKGLSQIKKFHFQINKNPLSLDQLIFLVEELQMNCKQLDSLTLDFQGLQSATENSMKNLLQKITEMSQLQSLSIDLENSKITPELVEIFTKRLVEMKCISILHINLKNNNIGDAGCTPIKKMLLQMPHLKSLALILDVNRMTIWGINELIEGINSLKYLNQLTFSIMANQQSDKMSSVYSSILKNTQYLSQVSIHVSGRFKNISEEFASYYKKIYIMILEMSVFINYCSEYQLYNPCFIMQDLFYD